MWVKQPMSSCYNYYYCHYLSETCRNRSENVERDSGLQGYAAGVNRMQGTVGARMHGCNPSLGSLLHPHGLGESRSNNPLYTKTEVFFILIHGEKVGMTLLCSFTASRRLQTSSKTNWVLPVPISH